MARLDTLCAVAVGTAAFAGYLRTLAPGLVAVFDTPMFQFIGRVLGVAHNPGYPLYVLLTFPFSYLPIGSLAYRINLFSAVLAALAVSLTFLIGRQLGVRRTVSAAAALGFAFGAVFWSQATIAEVYTLNAAIVAGMLLALLVWGETGRPAFFFTAIALFAAGLGNHTTIVGFAPGMAIYALLKDRRFVVRVRTLVPTVLILLAGLLQYSFIIIRSRQQGAYVESRATTVGDLANVMRGEQFGNRLFAFGWRDVLFERLPLLFDRVLLPELTLPGLALAMAGAVWLLRRRLPEGLLILLGGFAVFAFTLNYAVVDAHVFLVPTLVALWVAAAAGAEQAVELVHRHKRTALIVAVATLAIPGWQLVRNFETSDRSRNTGAAVTFERLFDTIPDRSAIVREDFLVDRMVLFKLLGEGAGHTRHIQLASRDANALHKRYAANDAVFGFQRSVRQLRYDGMNFDFAPMPLVNGALEDFLARLPNGTFVALAVPSRHMARWATALGISTASIGGPGGASTDGNASLAIAGVRAGREALVKTGTDDLRLRIHPGEVVGRTRLTIPAAIEIWSDATEAAVRQGSRDLVRSSEGAVLAVWNAEGELEHTLIMQASDDFRVPISSNALSVYPLRGTWPSQEIQGDAWTDVGDTMKTGSTMVRVPADSVAVIYFGSTTPLVPRVIDRSSNRASVEFSAFDSTDRTALHTKLQDDALHYESIERSPYVYRMAARAPRTQSVSVLTALGGIPAHAVGRSVGSRSPSAATFFRIDTMGLLRTPDRTSEVLQMARNEEAQLIGDGWSAVDSDEISPYRWMIRTEARLLLPIAKADAARIRIQALLEDDGAPSRVGLRVNGVEMSAQELRRGWHSYEWGVAGHLKEPLANDLVVTIDRLSPPKGETQARGLAVTELRVIHDR